MAFERYSAQDEGVYVVYGRTKTPLARIYLTGSDGCWEAEVLEGSEPSDLVAEGTLRMIGLDGAMNELVGSITGCRGDILTMEAVNDGDGDGDVRRNLRVPIHYDTYIYLCDGDAQRRCAVHCLDLSCGGIAFTCPLPLSRDDEFEVMVRMSPEPLLVRARVLRVRSRQGGMNAYAAKFMNLCHDEEKLLRKEVFDVQLRAAFAQRKSARERGESEDAQ